MTKGYDGACLLKVLWLSVVHKLAMLATVRHASGAVERLPMDGGPEHHRIRQDPWLTRLKTV